jgi:hypothetical protein
VVTLRALAGARGSSGGGEEEGRLRGEGVGDGDVHGVLVAQTRRNVGGRPLGEEEGGELGGTRAREGGGRRGR